MRFVLGTEHAAGFYILDSRNMGVAYLDASTREKAQACVDAWNVIDTIRERHEADICAAKALLESVLNRRLDDAA